MLVKKIIGALIGILLLLCACYLSFLSEKPQVLAESQFADFLPKETLSLKGMAFLLFGIGFFLVLSLLALPVDLLSKIPIIGIPFGIAGAGIKMSLAIVSGILALGATIAAWILF